MAAKAHWANGVRTLALRALRLRSALNFLHLAMDTPHGLIGLLVTTRKACRPVANGC